MKVSVYFPKKDYRKIRSHLFKGHKEQAAFLFVTSKVVSGSVELSFEDFYLIPAKAWDHQSSYHLDLSDEEKLKIMLEARKRGTDLIECHSHRGGGEAFFSRSDLTGFDDFVEYVWWKLPGKIYGAIVFTEKDYLGQIWLPRQTKPYPLNEINIKG